MNRRREPRIPAEFAVEIWGRNEIGSPFAQTVCVRNISRGGALLIGIDHTLRCGDVIEIHFADKVARFRVVWTLDSGCRQRKTQAAVHLLDGYECPWSEELEPYSNLVTA
jgi:PilZ domain